MNSVQLSLHTERRLIGAPATPGEGFAYFRWRSSVSERVAKHLMGYVYREAWLLQMWKANKRMVIQ